MSSNNCIHEPARGPNGEPIQLTWAYGNGPGDAFPVYSCKKCGHVYYTKRFER